MFFQFFYVFLCMILIADCGSTKIDWRLLSAAEVAVSVQTPGMNAAMLDAAEITRRLRAEALPLFSEYARGIEAVYFYGAGCLTDKICRKVTDALGELAPNARIEACTDMLAAARALCGNAPGIACILGTGSNCCFYDGEKIVGNVSPLGYVLGDEGSGAVLGKLLIGNVFKQQLPQHLCEMFLSRYGIDAPTVIEHVYRRPGANRYLASFAPFLKENIGCPEVNAMVTDAFSQFFIRNIVTLARRYNMKDMPVQFVGSIAHHFSDQLTAAARSCGFSIGKILESPIEGLIEYHSSKN